MDNNVDNNYVEMMTAERENAVKFKYKFGYESSKGMVDDLVRMFKGRPADLVNHLALSVRDLKWKRCNQDIEWIEFKYDLPSSITTDNLTCPSFNLMHAVLRRLLTNHRYSVQGAKDEVTVRMESNGSSNCVIC